jgi:hypothetical protein
MKERACVECGSRIILCNGFTCAGDVTRVLDGEIGWSDVRETCGLCVLVRLVDEGQL